jgi:hypothetical protein
MQNIAFGEVARTVPRGDPILPTVFQRNGNPDVRRQDVWNVTEVLRQHDHR